MTGFNARNFKSNMKLEDEENGGKKKKVLLQFSGTGQLGHLYMSDLYMVIMKHVFKREMPQVEKQNPSYA